MTHEQARVLARSGNLAVTWLDGRAFPGLHVQGDTFAGVQGQIADVARRLRSASGDSDALDDLDHAVRELADMLHFYESTLEEREIRRPYFRHEAG
ncbi:DUF6959 family protein [Dactylosporangium sp. CA-139114]|uniref:DUF6959 family protein n=1 Tax=Dactylosporangium sp. CA-139114 TaxID=3239931 RepID=UPI003D967A01